jgi:uncharacterized protein involved in exopolysaccharide biosynthesis
MRRDIGLELRSAEARERKSTIAFTISYRGSDPQKVALVTNTLASFYIEENLKVREKESTGTADFLKVQLAEVQGRLDDQERKVSEFKKLHTGELPQELEVNLATLERLNAQLRLNNDNLSRAMAQREAVARQMDEAVPGSVPGAPGAPEPAEQRLARLRLELAELSARFSEKYPDVIRAKAEIADLERQLAEPRPQAAKPDAPAVPTVDPATRRVRQILASVDAEIKVLQGRRRASAARSPPTSGASRTRRSASRSSRTWRGTTTRRGSCTPPCSSATPRPSSPRAWSSGRRASSSGCWIRPSPRRRRRPPTGLCCC